MSCFECKWMVGKLPEGYFRCKSGLCKFAEGYFTCKSVPIKFAEGCFTCKSGIKNLFILLLRVKVCPTNLLR